VTPSASVVDIIRFLKMLYLLVEPNGTHFTRFTSTNTDASNTGASAHEGDFVPGMWGTLVPVKQVKPSTCYVLLPLEGHVEHARTSKASKLRTCYFRRRLCSGPVLVYETGTGSQLECHGAAGGQPPHPPRPYRCVPNLLLHRTQCTTDSAAHAPTPVQTPSFPANSAP
jgi:hypothetical protein